MQKNLIMGLINALIILPIGSIWMITRDMKKKGIHLVKGVFAQNGLPSDQTFALTLIFVQNRFILDEDYLLSARI